MNTFADPVTNYANEEKKDYLSLKEFFNKILSKWWLFILSIGFFVGGACLFLRYATPMYKIAAKILIEDEKKGGSGVNTGQLLGDMSSMFEMKSSVDNEVEILKTRQLASKVVKALNLNITYFRKGTIKNLQLYNSPFKVDVIGAIDSIKSTLFELTVLNSSTGIITYRESESKEAVHKKVRFDHPFILNEIGAMKITRNPGFNFIYKNYCFIITSEDLATSQLQKDLSIAVSNKLVTIIDITLNHPVPERGEEILTKFLQFYSEGNINIKNQLADSTVAFIDNRLMLVSRELGGIEENIQSFKQTNQLADIPEQSKLLVANTNKYTKELSDIKTQISIIQALEDYLADNSKNKSVVPNSIQLEDPVFNKIAENYNNLLIDRERQLLSSTENNPYVQNLDQRIASLRKSMLANLAGNKRSMEINAEQLQQSISSLGSQIHKVPVNERAYLGLFRQQTLKQELYLFLLKKREEIALSKTSNIPNSKIIDPPKSNPKPYSPNRLLILALGVVAGICFPLGLIVTIDLLNDKILKKEEIIRLTSLPVYGVIGNALHDYNYVNNNPQSIISEQFRALRTNLFFALNEETGVTVLVTSSMHGEGKTFTTINLATILAISGKKILLIDLDLRKGSLTSRLQAIGKPGFSTYMQSSNDDFSDKIHSTDINENLFLMPTGMLPPFPAEMIMDKRTQRLLENLKLSFDYIIIDSPPAGLISDAKIINKYVSFNLFVVRYNYTQKNNLVTPKDLYLSRNKEKMAVVLNDFKTSRSEAKQVYGYKFTTQKKSGLFRKNKPKQGKVVN